MEYGGHVLFLSLYFSVFITKISHVYMVIFSYFLKMIFQLPLITGGQVRGSFHDITRPKWWRHSSVMKSTQL